MYFLSTYFICSIIHDFPSEYKTGKSSKAKTLFQTQQNLFQVFGFFPWHLPYFLFLFQVDQTQDEKTLVKIQLDVENTSKEKAFFLLWVHYFLPILSSFQAVFLCACMVDTCGTLKRCIVVLFSLNPCIYFEMLLLLLRSKEEVLSSLSTLTLLLRRQTQTNHS